MALTFLGALAGGVGVQLNVALGKVGAFIKKSGCAIFGGEMALWVRSMVFPQLFQLGKVYKIECSRNGI